MQHGINETFFQANAFHIYSALASYRMDEQVFCATSSYLDMVVYNFWISIQHCIEESFKSKLNPRVIWKIGNFTQIKILKNFHNAK